MLFWSFILLVLSVGVAVGQRKILCLDNRSDVLGAIWTSTAEIKSVESVDKLPKSFGDLKALGRSAGTSGIWYLEGTGTGSPKEVVFKSPLNAYSNKAKSVTLYVKFYANSQRRLALYPTKPGKTGGSLYLFSSSTATQWGEISKEIDPKESPIEITAHLGANEYVLFDKIVLAVDTPLPSDLSLSCKVMNTPPTLATPTATLPPLAPWVTPTSSNPRTLSPSTPTGCPVLPEIPECKCNCLCNCSKC